MNFNTLEVALTLEMRGAQRLRGVYNFKEVDNAKDGEDWDPKKAKIDAKHSAWPQEHKCYKNIRLKSDFILNAISSRNVPKTLNKSMWSRVPKIKRLIYWIKDFAQNHPDLDGEYTFEIID